MALVTCPECNKRLKVADTSVGKKVKCTCGHIFVAQAESSGVAPAAEDAPKVMVSCSECSASLKVASASLGKKMKCPKCGEVFVAALGGAAPPSAPVKPARVAYDDDEPVKATVKAKPPAFLQDDADDEVFTAKAKPKPPPARSDDDEEEERPRAKPKPRKPEAERPTTTEPAMRAPSRWPVNVLVFLLLASFIGFAALVYFMPTVLGDLPKRHRTIFLDKKDGQPNVDGAKDADGAPGGGDNNNKDNGEIKDKKQGKGGKGKKTPPFVIGAVPHERAEAEAKMLQAFRDLKDDSVPPGAVAAFGASTRPILSLTFSPTAGELATVSENDPEGLRIWDLAGRKVSKSLPLQVKGPDATALFSHNGAYLAVLAPADKVFKIWTSAGVECYAGDFKKSPRAVAFTKDNKHVVVVAADADQTPEITLLETGTWQKKDVQLQVKEGQRWMLSPVGKLLVDDSNASAAEIHDLLAGASIKSRAGLKEGLPTVFTADGEFLVSYDMTPGSILPGIYRIPDNEKIDLASYKGHPISLQVTMDSRYVLAVTQDQIHRLIHTGGKGVVWTGQGARGPQCFSPGGEFLAQVADSMVNLYPLADLAKKGSK